jgi:hypothetical protein
MALITSNPVVHEHRLLTVSIPEVHAHRFLTVSPLEVPAQNFLIARSLAFPGRKDLHAQIFVSNQGYLPLQPRREKISVSTTPEKTGHTGTAAIVAVSRNNENTVR